MQRKGRCYRAVRYLCERGVNDFVLWFYQRTHVVGFFPSPSFCLAVMWEVYTESEVDRLGNDHYS